MRFPLWGALFLFRMPFFLFVMSLSIQFEMFWHCFCCGSEEWWDVATPVLKSWTRPNRRHNGSIRCAPYRGHAFDIPAAWCSHIGVRFSCACIAIGPVTLLIKVQTCRRWNRILKDETFVYSLLCYKYGYIQGQPDPNMTISARIEALEAHVSQRDRVQSKHVGTRVDIPTSIHISRRQVAYRSRKD